VNGLDNPTKPLELPASAKKGQPEAKKWDGDIHHYLNQRGNCELNEGKALIINLGHCTLAVKNKLIGLGHYQVMLDEAMTMLLHLHDTTNQKPFKKKGKHSNYAR
jgi:hypothetical protein